uniref:ribosomal protein L22 n=1 Tax=Zostera japonica TaxID=187286 RepID=UPI001D0F630D|nr:ribosomal protein L22 [Zostera japonica]QZQ52880.1 ribosomal protein L22 [Zostera japonica]
MSYRASSLVLKVLYSAASNVSHNMGLNKANFYISRAEMNTGPFCKKRKARSSRS